MRHNFALLILTTTLATAPLTAQNRMAIGVVDESRLRQARSDYPALSRSLLPQIAAKRKLQGIVFKSGLAWSASTLKQIDVTADVLAKLRALPGKANKAALTAEQYEAANKIIAALTQLNAATDIGVSRKDSTSRLIDTKTVVEMNLRLLPANELRDKLAQTLKIYVESSRTWEFLSELVLLKERRLREARDFEDRLPLTNQERLELEFKREDEDKANKSKNYEDLFKKWNEANALLQQAIKLMPTQKS